ncbi:MAG: tol-pal system YbgF family protein, partial [Acidobacteriota bacterium]
VRVYQRHKEEKAAARLAVALDLYRAPVVEEPVATEGSGEALSGETVPADEHGPTGHRHFASEAERYKAARVELQPIVVDYPNTASGKMAAFYLGLCDVELGNHEAAEESLQRAAGAAQELISSMALYRLGQLHLQENRPQEAVANFDQLLSAGKDFFPPEEALMGKARAHEAGGDPRAALVTYQQVVDEYASSFSAIDARARVEELSAQLGLDADVEGL